MGKQFAWGKFHLLPLVKNSAVRGRLNEYWCRGLNDITEGENTKLLLKELEFNDVVAGLRVFRLIRIIEEEEKKKLKPITQKHLEAAAHKLQVDPFDLKKLLWESPILAFRLEKGSPRTHKSGRIPHYALHIIQGYLGNLLKLKGVSDGAANGLIDGFLSEQDIFGSSQNGMSKEARDESTVRKQKQKYNPEKLEEIYHFFQHLFLQNIYGRGLEPTLVGIKACRTIVVDKPLSERDCLFPEWEHFFPTKLE